MEIVRPASKQPLPENAKKVFTGIVFDVYQWEVKGYDGSVKTFEKIARPDSAMVVPVTKDKKIIVGVQEQPGKGKFVGLIGGRVDEGEDAFAAVQRELAEETGYKAESWDLLDAVQPLSKVEWAVYTFLAKGCVKVGEQELDGAEKIDLQFVEFDEFVEIVLEPEFGDTELRIKFLEARSDPEKMTKMKQLILGQA